jgi:RNA polymerase sigma-70 factor (sigma-E family)
MTRQPSDADFTDFVVVSWPRLYRTAYFLLGDHSAAEDLVQTSLAKTYASWGKVRTLESAPGYARTILINTAMSWFRKKSWRNELPTEKFAEDSYQADLTERPMMTSALGELAPRQRAVIVLRYYEDMSVAETATVLDCSPGTVKSQTFDALARLRTILGEYVIPTSLGATDD